jgi:hypothetical protein
MSQIIGLRNTERMCLVLTKRKTRFVFTSEKKLIARKMARAGASPADIAAAVGWPGNVQYFCTKLRELNILAGRMPSAVEYGA